MLLAKHSGATACLICLEKVRVTDPIWDCKTGCHAVFHLLCIQSWAQQALGTAAVHSLGQLSGQHFPMAAAEAEEKARWHCPKCRSEYSKSELPREYRCFCGKQVDPVNDPWLAPHTCGDKCERPLPGDCGHNCVLLCHPGPCPTCPQLLMFRYGFDYMLVTNLCGSAQLAANSQSITGLWKASIWTLFFPLLNLPQNFEVYIERLSPHCKCSPRKLL
jgi:NF-X1-type zinc finger protein NFXL1